MRIEIALGDITVEQVDAVVNAANSTLLGGGGVDGAIHAAAGPSLLDECRALRADAYPDGLPAGQAVATSAGRMAASYVIHTVGPQHWQYPDGGVAQLRSCHVQSLRIARSLGLATVAFPAISCGVYGWAAVDAAPVAVGAVRQFDAESPGHGIEVVRFVLFNDQAHGAFSHAVSAAR